jgi:hypothetical protein
MRVTAVIPALNEERTIDRPADIPRLLAPILGGEADLVIASRATGGSEELDGQLGHLPRALPAQVARELLLRRPGFAIEAPRRRTP